MPLWVFAMALLLKAAMPFLAQASADLQGKTLVEVCSVYGMALVPLDGQPHDPASGDHGASHDDTHCPLTALALLATGGDTPSAAAPVLLPLGSTLQVPASSLAPDASARWVARLKHGPPTLT